MSKPVEPITRPRRTRAEKQTVQHLLAVLKTGGDARLTKIKRVRQSVRARSYENELKLSIAIERMAQELSA
jgi:hypothetical protein